MSIKQKEEKKKKEEEEKWEGERDKGVCTQTHTHTNTNTHTEAGSVKQECFSSICAPSKGLFMPAYFPQSAQVGVYLISPWQEKARVAWFSSFV